MTLSPIALFVYNRPEHTQKTLKALRQNYLASQSQLYIFSDGSKNPADKEQVAHVRHLLHDLKGFQAVKVYEQTYNQGLAESIVQGVTTIVNNHGSIIVLEDDIVTSPWFLQYMNDALALYASKPEVMHISGHIFPTPIPLPETFFYNDTLCWGWGTWKRAWKKFSSDSQQLLAAIKKNNPQRFDRNRGYLQQLQDNVLGKTQTWAIKWNASVYLHDGFCLQPKKTLTTNIGTDGSGAHRDTNLQLAHQQLYGEKIDVKLLPLEESKMVYVALYLYQIPHRCNSLYYYMVNTIITYLKKTPLYPWFTGYYVFKNHLIQKQKERNFLSKYGHKYQSIVPSLHISGWLTEDQMITLYTLAKSLQTPSPIAIEIGSWQGRSATVIAKALKEVSPQSQLFCIDPFNAQSDDESKETLASGAKYISQQFGSLKNKFMENIAKLGVADRITILEGFSTDFAQDFNKKIDYLFIDGNHQYEPAKKDFLDWSKKLRPGGVIIFHDVDFDPHTKPQGTEQHLGPGLVIKDYILNNPQWRDKHYKHGMYWATKA